MENARRRSAVDAVSGAGSVTMNSFGQARRDMESVEGSMPKSLARDSQDPGLCLYQGVMSCGVYHTTVVPTVCKLGRYKCCLTIENKKNYLNRLCSAQIMQ